MRLSTKLSIPTLLFLAHAAGAQAELHRFPGAQADERAGHAVAGAGDVDGDGYDDVIVGSPMYDVLWSFWALKDAGQATIYSGRTGQVIHTFRGNTVGEQLGWSVDGIGDVDQDGCDDVIVGRPGDTTQVGQATFRGGITVYSGKTGNAMKVWPGFNRDARFGHAVAGAGDVDGDGVPDFMAGAPMETPVPNKPNAGSVVVYSGANLGTLRVLFGSQPTANFGWSVGAAGDVDNNGRDDVLIGAPGYDRVINTIPLQNCGVARAYDVATGNWLLELQGSLYPGARFGAAVDGAGDVNGDGKPDLVVGQPGLYVGGKPNSGSVEVYSTAVGLPVLHSWKGNGGDQLGYAVSGIRDIDGDGHDDIAAGAPYADIGTYLPNAGRAYAYSGKTGATLAATGGNFLFAHMGTSVGGGGDVDADGRADMVFGAPRGNGNVLRSGYASVWGL